MKPPRKPPAKNTLSSDDKKLWEAFKRAEDITPLVHSDKVVPTLPSPLPAFYQKRAADWTEEPFFKRPQRDFDARIDLHGLTEDKAYERLCVFLEKKQQQGARRVLVITGKSGILSEIVPKWLLAMPFVMDIEPSKAIHGGKGALYITLKKRIID